MIETLVAQLQKDLRSNLEAPNSARGEGRVKRLVVVILLLQAAALCQKTYSKGQVIKWERQACGDFVLPQKPIGGIEQPSITSTEYCDVYQVKTTDRLFHITTSRHVSLSNGQMVEYRIERMKMFILKEGGKEHKFKIVGEEIPSGAAQTEKQ